MNDFLTFAEVAEQLKCTLKKVRTLVIENKTLRATRVTPSGVVLDSCSPEGHVPYDLGFDCHLHGDGEITCDVYGGDSTGQTALLKTLDVGALRVARKDLENFCTAHPHQAAPGSTLEANAVPLSKILPPALGESEPSALACALQTQAASKGAAVDAVNHTPDSERRLMLLRKLGGSAKYARSEWAFTGIGALVAQEKADGRKRHSEKTVRADLVQAAQAERDAKTAGFSAGLGQR